MSRRPPYSTNHSMRGGTNASTATAAQSSNQIISSSGARLPKLYCYTTTHSNGETYFLYWKSASGILGVSNLGDQVFETLLSRSERKKFLKNVAESIVESKWRSTFVGKALKLGKIGEDSVEIRYINESVELPRVEGSKLCQICNGELLASALHEIEELTHFINKSGKNSSITNNTNNSESSTTPNNNNNSYIMDSQQKPPAAQPKKVGRKRLQATGVVFDDD